MIELRPLLRLRVGPLPSEDLGPAALLLARAFRDNPLNRAVLDRHDAHARLRANVCGMRAHLPVAQRRRCLLGAWSEGSLVGALVSTPPYGYPLPPPDLGARVRALWGQGLRVQRRWAAVHRRLDARHPREPHWYLGTLGVHPRHQGRGIGSALLGAWLAEVDREPHPVYLETDSEENVPFYARAGFEVAERLSVLRVPVAAMRRPPAELREAREAG